MARSFRNAAQQFLTEDPPPTVEPIPQDAQPVPKGYRIAKETKSVRMQILVTPSLREDIKTYSRTHGMSMNDAINTILTEVLKNEN